MRKASSEPDPAPSVGATDGGMVPTRAPADVAWRVPGIAVNLAAGQVISCQWMLWPYRRLTQPLSKPASPRRMRFTCLSRARAMNARGMRSQCRPSGRAGASWAGPPEGAD
jgi:hypothetical protein